MEPAPDALLDRRSAQELADLRRRAYGPNADIDDDPAALARLAELEAMGRAPMPSTVGAGHPRYETVDPRRKDSDVAGTARAVPIAEPARVESLTAPSAQADHGALEDEADAVAGGSIRHRRRRRVLWGVLLLVALVAGVAAFSFFTRPPSDETLVRAPEQTEDLPRLLQDTGFLAYIAVEEDAFVEYEGFRGITPWVAPRQIGGSCVVLVLRGDAVGYGCGLGELQPVADLVVDSTDERWRDFDLRDGSILRFTLRGDILDVQIAEADPVL